MAFKTNVAELKGYTRKAPASNRSRIQHIIQLYEARKIPQFRSALNVVLLLSSTNKHTIRSNRAIRMYDEAVAKYGEATPVTGV